MNKTQTKNCTKCHQSKLITDFYKKKHGKNGLDSFCKQCRCDTSKQFRDTHREWQLNRMRRYCKENPEYVERAKQKTKLWRRTSVINSKGCIIRGVHKREYPENKACEICGRPESISRALSYHHWDNNNPSKGIWECVVCHHMSEQIDAGYNIVYAELKRKVTIEKSDLPCFTFTTRPRKDYPETYSKKPVIMIQGSDDVYEE